MGRAGASLPASRGPSLLLGHPGEDQALSALRLGPGEVRGGDLVLAVAFTEAHDGDVLVPDEPLDVSPQPLADLGQGHGDVISSLGYRAAGGDRDRTEDAFPCPPNGKHRDARLQR